MHAPNGITPKQKSGADSVRLARQGASELASNVVNAKRPQSSGRAASAVKPISTLSALLPTRKRPDFVGRAVRHHRDFFGGPLFVCDGSSEANAERVRSVVAKESAGGNVTLLQRSADTAYVERVLQALEKVTTPYVVLLADDDLYFPESLLSATRHLDEHPDTGVVWGHVLHFQIANFSPYGAVGNFCYSVPNPVARWLEDHTPAARLRELGQGPWTTTGWYAVQRTSILREIFTLSHQRGFGPDMVERVLNLWQPIRGKVVMQDKICIARQLNPIIDETRPMSAFAESGIAIAKLERLAVDALVESGVVRAEAASAVADALAPEIAQLKANDRRVRFGYARLQGRLMPLRKWLRVMRRIRNRRQGIDPLAFDSRFPKQPTLAAAKSELAVIAVACEAA